MKVKVAKGIHFLFIFFIFLLPLIFISQYTASFPAIKDFTLSIGGLLILFLGILWFVLKKQLKFIIKKEIIYLSLFIAYASFSIFFSGAVLNGLKELLPIFGAFCFFLVFVLFYHNDDSLNTKLLRFIQAVVIAGTIESLIVLMQFFGFAFMFSGGIDGTWRIFGTLGNPNFVVDFLLPVSFLTINLLFNEKRKNVKKLYLLSFFIIVFGIFSTFSRSGIILLTAGTVLYIFLYSRAKSVSFKSVIKNIIKKYKFIITGLAAALIFVTIFIPVLQSNKSIIKHISGSNSITGRIFIWKNTIDTAVRNLPFGTGLGGFAREYADSQYNYFKAGNTGFIRNASIVKRAHNDILGFTAELGIGVVFLLLFLYELIKSGLKNIRSDNLSIGIFTGTIIILGSSMLNFPLRVAPNLFLFFLFSGIIYIRRVSYWQIEKTLSVSIKKRLILPLIPVIIIIGHFAFRFLLSDTYLREGLKLEKKGDLAAAEKYFKKSLDMNSFEQKSCLALGKIRRKRGDFKGSIKIIKKSLLTGTGYGNYRELARSQLLAGKINDHLMSLSKRTYIFRNIIPYHTEYIKSLFMFSKFKKLNIEIKAMNKAVSNNTDLPSFWYKSYLQAVSIGLLSDLMLSGMKNPVSTDNFTSIVPDKNDLIIGTMGSGLYRYSTLYNRFKRIRTPGFSFIYIVKRINGNLWAGSRRGLFIRKNKKWGKLRIPGYIKSSITTILQDKDFVWLTTYNAIIRYDTKTHKFKIYPSVNGFPLIGLRCSSKYKNALYFGGYGQLIIKTKKHGLRYYKVDIPVFTRKYRKVPLVNAVHPYDNKLIGLCTDNGLFTYFVPGKQVVKCDMPHITFTDMTVYKKELLLLTEKGRLIRQNIRALFIYINRDLLSKASIGYMEEFVKRDFKSLVPDFKSNLVSRRLFLYSYGRLKNWVFAATKNGLLSQAGPWGKYDFKKLNLISPGSIVRWVASDNNYLYAADNRFLWRYNGKSFTRIHNFTAPSRLYKSGEIIYFFSGNRLYKISKKSIPVLVKIFNREIEAVAVKKDVMIVSIKNNQLILFKKGYKILQKKMKYKISAAALDTERAYIGTVGGGLYIMDIEKKLRIIKRFDRLDGFPDNTITALFLNKDQLWLGTKKGGFILVSLKSGSIFKERSWSRLPSNAINYFKSTAPNMIMFSQGNKLFIAGNDPESVLTLQSYFNWPLSISSSAVYKNKLVICGNGGLFIYSGFKSALKNYVKILKGGI